MRSEERGDAFVHDFIKEWLVRNRTNVRLVGIVLFVALLVACGNATGGAASAVSVTDAWVQSPATDRTGAAYMVIQNRGSTADKLLSASTDICRVAELHETHEMGGMMQMSPLASIEVPAGGKAELKPGGMHVMLIDLTRELKTGEKVTLKLKFEKAGEVTVTADVREQ
jgi:copper(I)-binding protein